MKLLKKLHKIKINKLGDILNFMLKNKVEKILKIIYNKI